MRGKLPILLGVALCFLACLEREYENPFLADDSGIEDGWELDRDGNGVSDSVEYYARDCEGTARECLRIAQDAAAALRDRVDKGGTGGDTAVVVRPKDTVVIVQPKDTVVVVQPKDTVVVVQPKDTVVVVQPKDTVVVVQPKDTVVVVQPKDTVVVVKPKDTVVAVTGIQAAAVYLPMGVAKVTPAVTVLPRDAKNKGYTLTSLDEAIVKVSGVDLVPVKPGTAKVRARTLEGGFTAEFQATVVLPDTNVYETAVAVAPMELTAGDAARAPSVTWTPANTTNQGYSLVSGNPSVVQVAVEGGASLCRPVSPGQATMTLTTRGKGLVATFKVTVKAAPILTIPVLSLSAEDMVLEKGATGAVPKVTVLPALATDKTYSLTSDNPKVVSVTGNALNALSGGRARVTAKSPDGPSATFDVTVRVPVVSVSSPDLVLKVGAKTVPVVSFQPADADNRAYTLASSNDKIVSVDGETLTAEKKGNAEITITAADGAKTFLFKVKVEEAAAGGGDKEDGEGEGDGEEETGAAPGLLPALRLELQTLIQGGKAPGRRSGSAALLP